MLQPLHSCLSVLLLGLLVQGCGSGGHPAPGSRALRPQGEWILTREEIRRGGALDAWDAISRVPGWSLRAATTGEAQRIRRSGAGDRAVGGPEVIVNGVRLTDVAALRGIHADAIERIRLISGSHAFLTHGGRSGSGLIIIETRRGHQR